MPYKYTTAYYSRTRVYRDMYQGLYDSVTTKVNELRKEYEDFVVEYNTIMLELLQDIPGTEGCKIKDAYLSKCAICKSSYETRINEYNHLITSLENKKNEIGEIYEQYRQEYITECTNMD